MTPRPVASISSDIDTLESIYQGRGLTRPGGYSYAEFEAGLTEFHRVLEPFKAQATLFMVGRDLARESARPIVRAMHDAGHEIANHTMTHAQGFRLLSHEEQTREVAGMEEACVATIGQRPVGFRSPGWNIDDRGADLLRARGYLYDSSVFPTSLMPLLKAMHWRSTWSRERRDRTTMGRLSYVRAPRLPYRSRRGALGHRGSDGIFELPVTVTPVLRLPFFATWLLATGFGPFHSGLRRLRAEGAWIQFQFHLSDFVEYAVPEFEGQVPHPSSGVYVPQALRTPLADKVDLFRRAIAAIAEHYDFAVMRDVATREIAAATTSTADPSLRSG